MSSRRDVTFTPKMLNNLWLRTFPTDLRERRDACGLLDGHELDDADEPTLVVDEQVAALEPPPVGQLDEPAVVTGSIVQSDGDELYVRRVAGAGERVEVAARDGSRVSAVSAAPRRTVLRERARQGPIRLN